MRNDKSALQPRHLVAAAGMGRRDFLRVAGSSAAFLGPVTAACSRAAETRSLSFVHTHTGETLSAVYFQSGAYRPGGLDRISRLLRDFRTDEMHIIDPRVLDILFDLQVLMNRDEPYQVISGYRSPRTNAVLRSRSTGVAEHSLHMQGQAIDVRVSGFSTRRLRELALQMGRGGVGFYPQSDFVHLDCGRVRFW
jgi:uncharacterized protein YcbK (DUF882 family)